MLETDLQLTDPHPRVPARRGFAERSAALILEVEAIRDTPAETGKMPALEDIAALRALSAAVFEVEVAMGTAWHSKNFR